MEEIPKTHVMQFATLSLWGFLIWEANGKKNTPEKSPKYFLIKHLNIHLII